MPVQRVLRYKLLLEDLKKKTPENHPDYKGLEEVLEKISVLAKDVNEALKTEENYRKLMKIQKNFVGNVKNIVVENRQFLKEGTLTKVCRKENKQRLEITSVHILLNNFFSNQRHFFLFSDVLVYASTVTGSSRQSTAITAEKMTNPNLSGTLVGVKFLFHRMIDLRKTRVKDLEDTSTQINAFQIITTEEKSFTVIAPDEASKDGWLRALRHQTEDLDDSMDDQEVAPVWLPDKDAKQCMICTSKFTTFSRRHHCRYCGRVICGGCSQKKIKLPSTKNAVRVCDSCHKDLKSGGSSSSFRISSSSTTLGVASEISSSGTGELDRVDTKGSISGAHGRTILRQYSGTMLVNNLGKESGSRIELSTSSSRSNSLALDSLNQIELNKQLPIHDQLEKLMYFLNEERNDRIYQQNLLREEINALKQENQKLKEALAKPNSKTTSSKKKH